MSDEKEDCVKTSVPYPVEASIVCHKLDACAKILSAYFSRNPEIKAGKPEWDAIQKASEFVVNTLK